MFKKLIRNFRWQRTADKHGPRRLTVFEADSGQIKAVSLERSGQGVAWRGAREFKPFELEAGELAGQIKARVAEIDRETQYLSIIVGDNAGLVRLLNFPGDPPAKLEKTEEQTRQALGIDDSFSTRQSLLPTVSDNAERKRDKEYAVLAAAMKRETIDIWRNAVIEAGKTPVSLVPAGIVIANLATAEMQEADPENITGFICLSSQFSILLLYRHERLLLARQFKTGIATFVDGLAEALGLDRQTAREILGSGSFDLSESMPPNVNNWMRQVGISLDFIERHYGQKVSSLRLHCNDIDSAKVLRDTLAANVDRQIDEWNQFRALSNIDNHTPDQNPTAGFAKPLCEAWRVMREGIKNEA